MINEMEMDLELKVQMDLPTKEIGKMMNFMEKEVIRLPPFRFIFLRCNIQSMMESGSMESKKEREALYFHQEKSMMENSEVFTCKLISSNF